MLHWIGALRIELMTPPRDHVRARRVARARGVVRAGFRAARARARARRADLIARRVARRELARDELIDLGDDGDAHALAGADAAHAVRRPARSRATPCPCQA